VLQDPESPVHERLRLTIKPEATKPAAFLQQQERFDDCIIVVVGL